MTVQGIGMQQQLQSSPHQQPCLMGTLGPLEEEVEEVDGGILVVVVGDQDVAVWTAWSALKHI